MAQSKREQYERKREHIQELAEAGEIHQEDAKAMLELCDAYDPENTVVTPNDADHDANRWGTTRKPTTLRQWLTSVDKFARDIDEPLLETTAEEINRSAQRMYDGEADSISGTSQKSTIATRQKATKKFLRHADAAADPDDIAVFDDESTGVDPQDMLSPDEFHAFRRAPEHPRDKTIVDLLLYTGQRNTAIRTLRIKDVNLSEEIYRLNSTADGLKGADRVGTWNPLLGAAGSVRQWLSHHPAPDNPEAYLLTERRDSLVRNATETISDDTVNRVLRETTKKAAKEYPAIENKPTHAQALRHNFVTMCKRDYDLDDDVIKRLIRHRPGSDVMNTTYAHLSDSDYIKKAKEAFGLLEEEDESPMTPDYCDTCREPLAPHAKACPNCGTVYTPDAQSAQQQLQQDIKHSYRDIDPTDSETQAKIDQLDQLLTDPQVKAALLSKLND